MSDNDFEVTKLTEEQLKKISGGTIPTPKEEKCSKCRKHDATKGGFIARDGNGVTLTQYFKGNRCDSCAEKELQSYVDLGYTFVQWLPLR